ncbi:MAG: ribosomal protein L7/L12 [Polyangiaceae bacterium]|nr:ribosomal protein L7/L12 [Polyangiaceae bacterium]
MPMHLLCTTCGFETDVGWFHHHPPFVDGFFATTLVVCSCCGTAHRVSIALRSSGHSRSPDLYDILLLEAGAHRARVLACLRQVARCSLNDAMQLAAAAPVIVRKAVVEAEATAARASLLAAGASAELRLCEPPDLWEPDFVPRQDSLEVWNDWTPGRNADWEACAISGARRGDFGEFGLAAQHCGRCSAVGTLVSDYPPGVNKCPRCGSVALEGRGGWIT